VTVETGHCGVFSGTNTREETCTISQTEDPMKYHLSEADCPADSTHTDGSTRWIDAVVVDGFLKGFNYKTHKMYIKLDADYVDPCKEQDSNFLGKFFRATNGECHDAYHMCENAWKEHVPSHFKTYECTP
jgi:hypothetical protein